MIAVLNAANIVRYASPSTHNVLGYAPDELEGRAATMFVDPDDMAQAQATFAAHLREPGSVRRIEFRVRHKDGSWRMTETIANNRLHDPAVRGIVLNCRDITDRKRAEEALRASEERHRALTEHASDLVAIVDARGIITYASPSYARILGYPADTLEGTPALALVHPDDLARVRDDMARRVAEGGAGHAEFRVRHADGSWRIIEMTTNNRLHDPAILGVIATVRDVTARRAAEEGMARLMREHTLLLDAAGEGIYGMDRDGHTTFVNPAAARTLGYAPEQLIGRSMHALVHYARPDGTPYPQDACPIHATLISGEIHRVADEVFWRKDGTNIPVEYTSTPIHEGDALTGAVVTFRDITERKRAEEALSRQALHDALTDLPNRALLHDRLAHALAVAARERTPLALFLMDLDRFKEVNDTLGHDAGDDLLREVGRRVQGALRASDTVARLGGDEFAMLLPGADTASATEAARKLLSALAEPVTLHEQIVFAGSSVGIALYPDHGEDAAALLRQADVAMYAVKRGGGGYAVYNPAHDRHTPRRLTLIGALHRAIARDELRLHYQPTVDVTDGRVHMVEALTRWQHPELGLLPPDEFIPLAEQTGIIVPLTRWVLETAVRQVRAWLDEGLDLGVAVNLSARTLRDPELPEAIAELLQAHGVPVSRLHVELTESMVMADPPTTLEVLTRLSRLGVHIAIDDFGTGYSSLTHLKRLPIDEIKIDRSFVTTMTTDSDDATIVASTIGLGHSLGLRFVAEGVEDERTWQALEALNCDGAQGFYVSHALPSDELGRWLRETSWRPPASVEPQTRGDASGEQSS